MSYDARLAKSEAKYKVVKTASDVPKTKHYAIIVYKTTTVYEDNGYGDSNRRDISSPEHMVFLDHANWVEYIKYLETYTPSHFETKPTYVAFVLNSLATVETNVIVEVK